MQDLLTLVISNKCISHTLLVRGEKLVYLSSFFLGHREHLSYRFKTKPPQNPYTLFICCHALCPPTPIEHQSLIYVANAHNFSMN